MNFIDNISKQYEDHYKFIGEIKRKAKLRQDRRIKVIFFLITLLAASSSMAGDMEKPMECNPFVKYCPK